MAGNRRQRRPGLALVTTAALAMAMVLTTALAMAAGPAQAAPSSADLMVAPPAPFRTLTEPAAINGPLTAEMLGQLAGKDSLTKVPKKERDAFFADSYSRSFINEETADAIVIFGFHTPSDDDAVDFMQGFLDSTKGESRLKRDPSGPANVSVFALTDEKSGKKGQIAAVRKGRYVYQFTLIGQYPDADKDVVVKMAEAQLAKLPPGALTWTRSNSASTTQWAARLLLLAIGAGIVALFVRRSRRPPTPEPVEAVEPLA
jgi:hypothetical protein